MVVVCGGWWWVVVGCGGGWCWEGGGRCSVGEGMVFPLLPPPKKKRTEKLVRVVRGGGVFELTQPATT